MLLARLGVDRSARARERCGMTDIERFEVNVAQAELDDLAERLTRVRWTDPAPGDGYGVGLDDVQDLVRYWRDRYDRRAWEARLNRYPQYTTVIDGQPIHFLHVRSPEHGALPLILTHGWPGSVVEFLDIIEPLTNPAAHGGDPADAFHIVIPSLPGFGFSGRTVEADWGTSRTAKAWAALMARLGYDRYGAGGSDAGSLVSPELARIDADHVAGVHVAQIYSFPSGDPAEFEGMSADDMAALQKLQWFMDTKFSFNQLHSQQPQTLAHALADSPVGLLGWNLQLMDPGAMGDGRLDADFILTNVAIYWFTNTGGSSIRFYYENAHAPRVPAKPSDRDGHKIVQWHLYDAPGGHYAAHLQPEVVTDDIRGFYRQLR
jgi:pimeloyl-ACP methyl ester carboxylesterase